MIEPKRKLYVALVQALCGGVAVGGALPAAVLAADDADQAVIVTAQSRSQEQQSVPIALQVLSEEQFDKLATDNLSAMNGYVPGLSVDGQIATLPTYYLRGVGNADFGIGTDSPVGVYVDGVYASKNGGSMLDFNDVERVEVLKGPQGTLFGRNSAGGAISIVSKEPRFDNEEAATVRFGNFGEKYGDALLNTALGDKVAVRFNVMVDKSDGWLPDAATGQTMDGHGQWGLRGSLLWKPFDDTKIVVSLEHTEMDQTGRATISVVPQVASGVAPPYPANPANFVNPLNAAYEGNVIGGSNEGLVFNGVTVKLDHVMDWAEFNSISAFRGLESHEHESRDGTDNDVTHLDTGVKIKDVTLEQEFKLSGDTKLANWVAGVSLFHENSAQSTQLNTQTQTLNTLFKDQAGLPVYSLLNGVAQGEGLPVSLLGNPWQENIYNHGHYDAYAAYGDVIWHLLPDLNLTTGVRFTRDDKTFDWFDPTRQAAALDANLAILTKAGFLPGLAKAGLISQAEVGLLQGVLTQNQLIQTSGATTAPFTANKSWQDTSPRAVLDYHFTPDLMVYGSVTKGYQAGGYNTEEVAGGYQPETVWNYEAGIKSDLRDYHLTVNASVFLYNFTNLQNLTLVTTTSATVPSYQVTSSNQRGTGLDLDVHWRPITDMHVFVASEYIDQRYKDYVANDGTSLSGQPTGTPSWNASVGVDYTWRDVVGGSATLAVQDAYIGPHRCNSDSVSQGECSPTTAFNLGAAQNRTDVNLGWHQDDGRWGVSLYANNLFDQREVLSLSLVAAPVGTPTATVTPPRMFGVEFTAKM